MLKQGECGLSPNKCGLSKGMTLIEIMVAIAVIAFIVIGGLYLFNIIKERHKIHNSVNDLGAIIGVINDVYGFADSYEGLSVESLINGGGIPKHLIIAGNTQHFNGVWGDINLSAEQEQYTITFNDVPGRSCSLFAERVRFTHKIMYINDKILSPGFSRINFSCFFLEHKNNTFAFKNTVSKEPVDPPAEKP